MDILSNTVCDDEGVNSSLAGKQFVDPIMDMNFRLDSDDLCPLLYIKSLYVEANGSGFTWDKDSVSVSVCFGMLSVRCCVSASVLSIVCTFSDPLANALPS